MMRPSNRLVTGLATLVLVACPIAFSQTPESPLDSATGIDPINHDGRDDPVYSNATFAKLVRKYIVNDGEGVDYAVWKKSPEDLAALDQQVALLAAVSPENHPEQFVNQAARRSYWINTYNTLVLHAVLELWPLESVRDVKLSLSSRVIPGKGFFYDREVIVGGKETNLYTLEKEVLKSQKDPRLHFALNCASNSCPVLRPWEWNEEQLDQAARDFVNAPANVSVENRTVYLSSIFKWYKKDFPRDTIAYLQRYAEPELHQQLQFARDDKFRTRYVNYDWGLNDSGAEDSVDAGGSGD